jgi:hypothetical protein
MHGSIWEINSWSVYIWFLHLWFLHRPVVCMDTGQGYCCQCGSKFQASNLGQAGIGL